MFVTQHLIPRCNKEWLPLATQQLRLRNLIQILAFSIKNDKREMIGSKVNDSSDSNYLLNESYYFTLHATTMSAPFYTSEKLKSDSPKWKELETSSWTGSVCDSVDALVIRLWFNNPQEPEDKVLAVWGVYFKGLMYLGKNLGADIPLKPNSLVFLMPGGYFTDPKCIESGVKICYASVKVNNSDVRPSYSVNSLTRLQALQQVIKKEAAQVEILKKKISMGDFFQSENRGRTTLRKLLSKHKPKTNHADLIRVKENIEIAKYRVNILKEEKTVLLQRLKELNKHIETLCSSNDLTESKIMENYQRLRREVQNHKDWKRSYIDRREKYLHSKAMLNFRTKQLISELNLIYPIVEVSTDKFTICGVHLPNSEDFVGHDDLQISVALGFVTHVIQMISIFLQIPLRYPVIHYGSRSKIIDQITDKIPDSERKFSLFGKGKEKLQFNYAVYLLNKNIAQMRWLCGLPTSDLRNTLENLSSLLKMKSGNSVLDQNSRSLSPSKADICSSTISVSSPVGSAMSFQTKRCPRTHYFSESVADCNNKKKLSSAHHISKSVGSSKELIKSSIAGESKKFSDIKQLISNLSILSFSLDKGLNEYKDVTSRKEKKINQYGSEPVLNYSDKVPFASQHEATNNFLKSWNADSQKVFFSDDDYEINLEHHNMQQNPLAYCDHDFKEDLKQYCTSCEKIKSSSHSSIEGLVKFPKSHTNNIDIFSAEENENLICTEDACSISKQQCTGDPVVQKDFNNSDVKKCDIEQNLVTSDALLENVTSRTEVLATQITSFNRFRTRFKSTLDNSN